MQVPSKSAECEKLQMCIYCTSLRNVKGVKNRIKKNIYWTFWKCFIIYFTFLPSMWARARANVGSIYACTRHPPLYRCGDACLIEPSCKRLFSMQHYFRALVSLGLGHHSHKCSCQLVWTKSNIKRINQHVYFIVHYVHYITEWCDDLTILQKEGQMKKWRV